MRIRAMLAVGIVAAGVSAGMAPAQDAPGREGTATGQPPIVSRGATDPVALAATPVPVTVPRGYRKVWDDDRLNPGRAQGTPLGEAQMNALWTQTVPRRLQAPEAPKPKTKGRAHARYVQVSAFGEPAKARTTAGRVKRLGLPAARGTVVSDGTPLTVIYAGPFATEAHLQSALATLRRAGFTPVFKSK